MADDPIKPSGDSFLDAPLEEYKAPVDGLTIPDVAAIPVKKLTKKPKGAKAAAVKAKVAALTDDDDWLDDFEPDSPEGWLYQAWAANEVGFDAFSIYVVRRMGPLRQMGRLTSQGFQWKKYSSNQKIEPFFKITGKMEMENTSWSTIRELSEMILRVRHDYPTHVELEG